jgi:ABC-type polysaccharide/polyol phosphate export permease
MRRCAGFPEERSERRGRPVTTEDLTTTRVEPLSGSTNGTAVVAPAEPAPLQGPPAETMFRRRVRLGPALAEVWQFREIILTLAERDLRARYKQALLGFAWALVVPVTLMLVFTFFFTKFAHIDSQGAPYALYSYLGLIPWTFFYGSVNNGGMSIITNMPLVNKVYCPREIFPIAAILVAAVDTAASVLVLVILFPITGYTPHIQIVYAPLLILVELLFTLAVTLFISVMLVYLRDLRHALPLLLQLGLFATPVAYGVSAISKSQAFLFVYSALNPLSPVIEGFRRSILFGESPDWLPLAVGGASSVLFLAFAYRLFKRLETGVADIA